MFPHVACHTIPCVRHCMYTISFANFYWFETWMTVFQWFKKVIYISISWNMNIQPLLTNHIILIWVMFITLFIHLVRDPSSRGFWRAIFFGTMDHYNSFKTKIELKNLLSCPRNPCCSYFMCPNHHIRAWNHTLPLFNITFSLLCYVVTYPRRMMLSTLTW